MSSQLGNVLIGGGTGFIGSHLAQLLKQKGYGVTIISRMPGVGRITWGMLQASGLPKQTQAVVNLAGQNVLDPTQRWSAGFKQNVYNSRVRTTSALAEQIVKSTNKPEVFITMSGVGIYKPDEKKVYDEYTEHDDSNDFLIQLCCNWENAGSEAEQCCRVATLRSGVVLGRNGGMIKQLYLPFYLGLGGPIASGTQYLPWIHVDDITRLILFIIENPNVKGIINAVAPQQVTNQEFTNEFAKALGRPAIFRVPEFVLNILLNKERAQMLTQGQKVIPKRATEYKFDYKFPDIRSAVKNLVSKEN